MNKLTIKLLSSIILLSLTIIVISNNHRENSEKKSIEKIASINQIQNFQLDNLKKSGSSIDNQVKAKWAITFVEQNILTGDTDQSIIRSEERTAEASLSKL